LIRLSGRCDLAKAIQAIDSWASHRENPEYSGFFRRFPEVVSRQVIRKSGISVEKGLYADPAFVCIQAIYYYGFAGFCKVERMK